MQIQRLVIVLFACLSAAAWADEGVDISAPSQVAALTKLQETIDTISAAVRTCMNTGKSHNDCLCDNKALILGFKEIVEELFVAHPNLKTLDIVRFKAPDGLWVSQSLSGIKNQAAIQLTCT